VDAGVDAGGRCRTSETTIEPARWVLLQPHLHANNRLPKLSPGPTYALDPCPKDLGPVYSGVLEVLPRSR
jgi:hypothetical protein